MTKPHWTGLGLEDFEATEEPFANFIPGETPGHTVDVDALHELFHEQTKYHRATAFGLSQNIRAHIEQPPLIARCVMGRHKRGGQGLVLPEPGMLSGTLASALAERVTTRRENLSGPITAQTLSTLLHHSVRSQRSANPKFMPELTQHFRPYPSAGALYPCEVYIAISAVEGLPVGVYRYDAIKHDLLPCRAMAEQSGNAHDYSAVETGTPSAEPPACAIIVTSVFERSVRKYGLRGYRLALIEAGQILQNLSLVATALGLCSQVSASFYEAEVENLIAVDGVSEAALASFLIGPKIS